MNNQNLKNIKKIVPRAIQKNIEDYLFKGKIIIIYGARQVGKTTLVKMILKKFDKTLYLNCDEPDIRDALRNRTSTELKQLIGNRNIVVIDEAQRVENIGLTLKLLVDNYPEIQIIATGSSSFDLSNKIREPLTGRNYTFMLFPFSLNELKNIYSEFELERLLKRRVVFGMYPDIVKNDDINLLKGLADSYLYKDILSHQSLKSSDVITKLLQALALQVGHQVSYNEISSFVGIDKNTVSKYITILENAFVIFRLGSFSRNVRSELKKSKKIYFYDNGIRNSLLNNFNSLEIREDKGSLFENFMISERKKVLSNNLINKNCYFWRTLQQKEIDYIEVSGDRIDAFEFKYNVKKKVKPPGKFMENYKNNSFTVISPSNYKKFVYL